MVNRSLTFWNKNRELIGQSCRFQFVQVFCQSLILEKRRSAVILGLSVPNRTVLCERVEKAMTHRKVYSNRSGEGISFVLFWLPEILTFFPSNILPTQQLQYRLIRRSNFRNQIRIPSYFTVENRFCSVFLKVVRLPFSILCSKLKG